MHSVQDCMHLYGYTCHCGEVIDAVLLAVCLELEGVELAATIRAESPQMAPPLGFCLCLEFFESNECFILGSQQLHPHIPAEVINDEEEVAVPACRRWFPKMNQIQLTLGCCTTVQR